MNVRNIATTVFRLTVKMIIVVVIVAVFYMVCSKTFEYGAEIFSEEAMAPRGKGVDVVVTIPKDTSAAELGRILKANGLIKDANVFRVQAILYELIITPGTYEFSTENNVEDIIDIINENAPDEDEEESKNGEKE